MRKKHQILDENMVDIFNLTVAEAARYERPREFSEWLPKVADVAQLRKFGNVHTDVGYSYKTD